MLSGASDQLRQWLGAGVISAAQYQHGVDCCGSRPVASSWYAFLRLLTLIMATGALVFSLLFFIAFNWADMARLTKFALVEVCLLGAVFVYFYRLWIKHDDNMITGWLIVVMAMVIGGLLALFGQVYQTGADSWQLFFTWTLLSMPLMLVSRFMPMWLLWIGLCNLTLVLFVEQMQEGIVWLDSRFFCLAQVGMNSLFLLTFEFLRGKDVTFKPPSLTLGNALVCRFLLLICLWVLLTHLISWNVDNPMAKGLLPLWLALAFVFYYRFRRDLFNLSCCLIVMAIYIAWVGDADVYHQLDSLLRLLISGSIFLLVGVFGGRWLRGLAQSELLGDHKSDVGTAGEAITASETQLWQQLIAHNVVNEQPMPQVSKHFVLNIMGVFSALGMLAGIFLLLGLAMLFPPLAEEAVIQVVVSMVCLFLSYVAAKKTVLRSDFYVVAVVMFIMAQLFLLLCLYHFKLNERYGSVFYMLFAIAQLWLFSLKSLRFLLVFFAGIAALRLFDLWQLDGLIVVLLAGAWIYVALNENRLITRFGLSALIPFSHGLLVVLLLAAIANADQYQLYNAKITDWWLHLQQHWQFVFTSLSCFAGLVTVGYVISARDGRRFKRSAQSMLILGLMLIITLVLLFSIPMVTIALVMVLCGMYLQRRLWLIAGCVSGLYFMVLFYYDLDATLDIKALYLLLFAVGVLFIRYLAKTLTMSEASDG